MKKLVIVSIISLFLGFFSPLFSQTFSPTIKPEECIIPSGYLLVEEKLLMETVKAEVKKAIDKAVDEAVAVAVKVEQKKNVDLQATIDTQKVELTSKDVIIKKLKSDNVKNVVIATGIGFGVGIPTGMFVFYLIDKALVQ